MGLLSHREKRRVLGYLVAGFVILGVIGLSIQYWYVTLPVVAVIISIVLASKYSKRKVR